MTLIQFMKHFYSDARTFTFWFSLSLVLNIQTSAHLQELRVVQIRYYQTHNSPYENKLSKKGQLWSITPSDRGLCWQLQKERMSLASSWKDQCDILNIHWFLLLARNSQPSQLSHVQQNFTTCGALVAQVRALLLFQRAGHVISILAAHGVKKAFFPPACVQRACLSTRRMGYLIATLQI